MPVATQRIALLKELWAETTHSHKHSAYQSLPVRLAQLMGLERDSFSSKEDAARLAYILSKVYVPGKRILDIGCNTGFFLFEALAAGALHVTAYEGSHAHAAFVNLSAELLGLTNQVDVRNEYFEFDNAGSQYDMALLLNVLHHLGDDYGDSALVVEQAKVAILKQLNFMSKVTSRLVFQLGFNWRGDPKYPLFANGTKEEVIEYVREGSSGCWRIDAVGVAERCDAGLIYRDVNELNIQRNNTLGEFFNRPIFIMDSLCFGK
jgi:SAM-dependent methyltransferase